MSDWKLILFAGIPLWIIQWTFGIGVMAVNAAILYGIQKLITHMKSPHGPGAIVLFIFALFYIALLLAEFFVFLPLLIGQAVLG